MISRILKIEKGTIRLLLVISILFTFYTNVLYGWIGPASILDIIFTWIFFWIIVRGVLWIVDGYKTI